MDLLEQLERNVVCGDGAMGTLLLDRGVPLDRCLEELCVSERERIRAIHDEIHWGRRTRDRDKYFRR
jgi:methionine synthase / methylenetetrahydrofolate reductase(NADPH)